MKQLAGARDEELPVDPPDPFDDESSEDEPAPGSR
jgi:hypothetical protein